MKERSTRRFPVTDLLSDMRILIVEDEFLIAMDAEQLCRDSGAADVAIISNLTAINGEAPNFDFDVVILDIMLNGTSTLSFARKLQERAIPFVFASGYNDLGELRADFPSVAVLAKPYSGADLIGAVAAACGRQASSSSV